MVEAFPATRPMRDVFRSIAALIVITDLNARPHPKDSLVREALGLTGAEARLASKLAAGEELRRASDALGISYNTARSYLRSIFDKAQVSCERNLGLRAHEASRDADRPPFEFEWATDQPEPLDDQD